MKPREPAHEFNFDGLVGPTHNYSGLSFGNVASIESKSLISSPREAALQGLAKMKAMLDLGLKQGVLPPQERPDLESLRRLGFRGSDSEVLSRASQEAPLLLAAASSASSMWTANAATLSPSADTEDHKVHITPANLNAKLHRSIEPETTSRILKKIFSDSRYFIHHAPLPAGDSLGDEGAANHTRFCTDYAGPGLELFIYGRRGLDGADSASTGPIRFPARQTLEASQAVARLHRLDLGQAVFWRQNPEAVDAGVFHNDVASVGNKNVFFYHEKAFVDPQRLVADLQTRFEKLGSNTRMSSSLSPPLPLMPIQVLERDVTLGEAVKSYLFNSQLVSLPKGEMALIAPTDSQESDLVRHYLEHLCGDLAQPIRQTLFFDLKQSMRNGGGPACLRLRVVLTDSEIQGTLPQALLTPTLYDRLVDWVKRRYRDRLAPGDLADPSLLNGARSALDALTQILNLGSIYPFQLSV